MMNDEFRLSNHDDDDNRNGDKTATRFCDALARGEWLLCGMGDLWGRLRSKESLLVWWLARHAAYFGFAIGLVIGVPDSAFFLVPLFLVAHLYKFGRFLVQSSLKKRQKQQSNQKAKLRRKTTTTSNTRTTKQPQPLATPSERNRIDRPRDEKETAETVDIEAGA